MSAPFRIRYPKKQGLEIENQEPNPDYDNYLARLTKLIPGEAISIYLAAKNMAPKPSNITKPEQDIINEMGLICAEYSWLPLIGLIPLLIIRIKGTIVQIPDETSWFKKNDIEWPMVAISIVSYIIWVYAIGDCLFIPVNPDYKFVIAITVMLWTFLVPYLYKPSKPDTEV